MVTARAARFERLGIDVWVRRRPRAAAARTDASEPVPSRVSGPPSTGPQRPAAKPPPRRTPPPRPARAPAAPVAERLRIHCYCCGDVFLAIGEDAMPHRRFLLDVAAAVAGTARAERRELVFAWPQPGAPADGHERAWRAFFLRQMERCARAILAGAKPATLLGHPLPDANGPLGSHFYLTPRVPDGPGKERLWQQLLAWLAR